MKIATFNINGIKARIDALCTWLDEAQPDVALLQEIKSVDEAFPRELFEERGYNVATHGQKSFNGVAILSKLPIEDLTTGLPGDDSDEQARWIEATVVENRRCVFAVFTFPMATRRRGRNMIINWLGWKGYITVQKCLWKMNFLR